MMKIFFLKGIKHTIFLILFSFITVCNAVGKEQEGITDSLQTSFGAIYLARYGLNYPNSKTALNSCVQSNNQQCLDTYKYVTDAKNKIISLSNSETLDATMNIIEKSCLLEDEYSYCYGGIMSLYFYDSPEYDLQIISRIKEFSQTLGTTLFKYGYLWYHNRPEPAIWIDYISSDDIIWEDEFQQDYVLSMFKKDIGQLEDEPWVSR